MIRFNLSGYGLLESPAILIRFRWVALSIQLLCVGIGYYYQIIGPDQLKFTSSLIAFAFGLNALLFWLKPSKVFNFSQMLFDLSLAFGLLYLTGGLENPFYLVLMIHLFLAPFFLSGVFLFVLGGFSILYLYLLQFTAFQFSNDASWFVYDHVKLVSALTVSAVIWQVSRWLVSESRKLNQRILNLESFNRKIEKYRALGFLAAGVSHEIGTPLNTAQIRVDRLARNHTLSESEDLQVVRSSLQKTKAALKKLNDGLQELQEGDLRERVDLGVLLKQLIENYESGSDLKIHLEMPSSSKVEVEFPRVFLSRSMVDLFDNALEAGAINLWIKIQANEEDPSFWDLILNDDGEGFSDEILKRLGEPFVSSKRGGTGLGLYHLVNLISYLGGKIHFENRPKSGQESEQRHACIRITLKGVA